MNTFIKKVIEIAKKINSASADKYIEELPDHTYKKCTDCDGTGCTDQFLNIDCETCEGTSIIKKTDKELHLPELQ